MAVTKISEVTTLAKWTELTQNKPLFAKVLAFGQRSHNMESIEFLTSMKSNAKNLLTYNKYIKKGAPKEVNLSDKLAEKFHVIARTVPLDWSKAPWADAITEVLLLFRTNFKTVV